MSRALAALDRVRGARKKAVRMEHAANERARLEQEARVVRLHEAMERSQGEGSDEGEAHWLAQEQAYRLRVQMRLRQEEQVLQRCDEEVEQSRERLREADRDARVVELALERLAEEEALLELRADGRRIDSIAAGRWWRENA